MSSLVTGDAVLLGPATGPHPDPDARHRDRPGPDRGRHLLVELPGGRGRRVAGAGRGHDDRRRPGHHVRLLHRHGDPDPGPHRRRVRPRPAGGPRRRRCHPVPAGAAPRTGVLGGGLRPVDRLLRRPGLRGGEPVVQAARRPDGRHHRDPGPSAAATFRGSRGAARPWPPGPPSWSSAGCPTSWSPPPGTWCSGPPGLLPYPRAQLAADLARQVAARTAPAPPPGLEPMVFLSAVVAERRRREHDRLGLGRQWVPGAANLPAGWR